MPKTKDQEPEPESVCRPHVRIDLGDLLWFADQLAAGGMLPVTALTEHTAARIASFLRSLETQANLPGFLGAVKADGAPGLLKALTEAGYGDVVAELEKGEKSGGA